MHLIINFGIGLVNFLNVLGFLLLVSEKRRRLYVFNLLIFMLFQFIYFSVIMTQGYCSWNIFYDSFKCLRFLKGCLNAIFAVPISFTRKFRKNTHTHTPDCFSLKNHGQSFFLNHLFLPFNSRLNCGFYFCE